jgi:hypothetical protein
MKSESAIRSSLDAARPDFDADQSLDRDMADICRAMWKRATDRICAGKDSDGQRAIVNAREEIYNSAGRIYGSGLDSAAEYLRMPFADAVRDALA